MAELGDWLTTLEAARISGYHVEHIRRLIRAGDLRARKWGRDWMVHQNSLVDYLEKARAKGKRRGPKPG